MSNRPPLFLQALWLLLLTFPLVAAGQAPSAPVPPAAAPAQMQMLIWGGGATREQAEQALAEYQGSGGGWERFYALAPGFPRVLESKTVPGLKPGFFIVALGVCPAADASEALLSFFRYFRPAIYGRPVTWSEQGAACPTAVDGWSVRETERWKKKGLELSATVLSQKDEWLLLMRLRDKAGKVIDSQETDSKKSTPSSIISCASNEVLMDALGPSVMVDCEIPDCTTPAHSAYEVQYSVKGEKIQSKVVNEKYTKGECDQ